MTYDEVMSLSAKGLREQAALTRNSGDPKWRFGYDADGKFVKYTSDWHTEEVPDYPNNMSAAWELVKVMERKNSMVFICNSHGDNLNTVRIVRGLAMSIGSKEIFDSPTRFDERCAIVTVCDESVPRAITRAFILAEEAV